MKKILAAFTVLGILALLAWALPASAQDGRPKGLENRGPLTRITFIHYKKGHAKPPSRDNGKAGKCYDFLAKGARWKTLEPYLVNPTNADGLSSDFVKTAIDAGVTEWESYGGGIFGEGTLNTDASYNNGNLDGENTTSFDSYTDPGVIAVTTVWGYFSGPPQTRELVEWDILFNEHFTWGDGAMNPVLMDLQNIATHELGHGAGMDDLYRTSCIEETMYGYSTEGEIIKRDLNTGDIIGIRELYK